MLPSTRILVADPSAYVAELTASMLRGVGAKAIRTVNDSAAVLMVLAREPFDVLVIDDQLAPMDGVALTRRIRAGESGGTLLPVIMVFAEADRERIEAARDAGVTEFIKKPVSAKILEARITQALASPRAVVRAPAYIGPDRRRRTAAITGSDRRSPGAGNDN